MPTLAETIFQVCRMSDVAEEPIAAESVLGTARTRVAQIYAEAILAAAADANQIDSLGEELQEFVTQVFNANPEIEAFLSSPAVGRRARTEALAAATTDRMSPLMRNLLGVLNVNGRLDMIRPIAAVYRDLLDRQAGRVRVRVVSAVPLNEDQESRLASTLADRLKKTPVLSVTVDPNLLGGLVVRVGDQVFDTSIRTQLETLRNQLLDQGSSYVRNQN